MLAFRPTLVSLMVLTGISYLSVSGAAIAAKPQSQDQQPEEKLKIQISETAAPANWPNAIKIVADSGIIVNLPNGNTSVAPLAFHSLFQPGDRVGLGTTGVIENTHNKPLTKSLPSTKFGMIGQGPFISMSPTASITLQRKNKEKDNLYLVALYDSLKEGQDKNTRILDLWEKLPGTVELIELQQGNESPVTAVDITKVNSNSIKGAWFPAGGTKTPWGTVLSNQGREPDALTYQSKPLELANLYLETSGKLNKEGGANPYDYGYRIELGLNDNNLPSTTRRLSMGRYSGLSATVMPDERTVYITDDNAHGTLFMFVSDKAQDLSSGTLYAAQWSQQGDNFIGNGTFNWIKLGHTNDKSIQKLLDSNISFSDIFDHIDNKTYKANPKKYVDYKLINIDADQAEDSGYWIKPKKGMEQAAAFLESRRFAAYSGATTDFSHLKGLAFDPTSNSIYLAINQLSDSMILTYDKPTSASQHIKLTGAREDLQCGSIFKLDLYPSLKDHTGEMIDSPLVAGIATPVLSGQRNINLTASLQVNGRCDVERIAGPANLFYNPALNLLFISEEGSLHLNNYLWAYNTRSKSLTRILSAPIGADISGLDEFSLNKKSYLTVNIQQPATYSSLSSFDPELRGFIRRNSEKKASVGYIGPFPVVEQ